MNLGFCRNYLSCLIFCLMAVTVLGRAADAQWLTFDGPIAQVTPTKADGLLIFNAPTPFVPATPTPLPTSAPKVPATATAIATTAVIATVFEAPTATALPAETLAPIETPEIVCPADEDRARAHEVFQELVEKLAAGSDDKTASVDGTDGNGQVSFQIVGEEAAPEPTYAAGSDEPTAPRVNSTSRDFVAAPMDADVPTAPAPSPASRRKKCVMCLAPKYEARGTPSCTFNDFDPRWPEIQAERERLRQEVARTNEIYQNIPKMTPTSSEETAALRAWAAAQQAMTAFETANAQIRGCNGAGCEWNEIQGGCTSRFVLECDQKLERMENEWEPEFEVISGWYYYDAPFDAKKVYDEVATMINEMGCNRIGDQNHFIDDRHGFPLTTSLAEQLADHIAHIDIQNSEYVIYLDACSDGGLLTAERLEQWQTIIELFRQRGIRIRIIANQLQGTALCTNHCLTLPFNRFGLPIEITTDCHKFPTCPEGRESRSCSRSQDPRFNFAYCFKQGDPGEMLCAQCNESPIAGDTNGRLAFTPLDPVQPSPCEASAGIKITNLTVQCVPLDQIRRATVAGSGTVAPGTAR